MGFFEASLKRSKGDEAGFKNLVGKTFLIRAIRASRGWKFPSLRLRVSALKIPRAGFEPSHPLYKTPAKVDIAGDTFMISRLIRNLPAVFAILVFASFSYAQSNRVDPSRDVLAHSAGDWAWFAQVSVAKSSGSLEPMLSSEETEILVHHNIPGEPWKPLPTLPGRAVALASRMSQLVVLMSDGEWLTLWEDGSASGQPLPAMGRMKAIADDGNDLWAVGEVNGGLTIAQTAILREIASTMPATAPATLPLPNPTAVATSEPSLSPAMVLFRQINGRWAAIAELPPMVTGAPGESISLTVVNGSPLICYLTSDGHLETKSLRPDGAWDPVAVVKPPTTQPANFSLMTDGFKPILWVTPGNAAGELFADLQHGEANPVMLQWPGKAGLTGTPAATFAGGYLCVLGPSEEKALEQRYKATGEAVGTPAELSITNADESLLPHWLEAILLGFMGFSIGVRVFRQWSTDEDEQPGDESPPPAPLPARFFAGLIDAIPVLAGVGFVFWQNSRGGGHDLSVARSFTIISCSVGVYILHTTLTEVFTGRSAGKWLLGLKVVTTNGNPASKSQCAARNLLRLVDPLVMVLVTPLRQRDADTLVNTMVVQTSAKSHGSMPESDVR